PVCSPARHSLNTGQYCHVHGVTGNSRPANPGMFTLAHALKPRGYRCLHQGHMHWSGQPNGYEPPWETGWVGRDEWRASLSPKALQRHEVEQAIRRTTGGPGPRTIEEFSGAFVAGQTIKRIEEAVGQGEKFLAWCSFSEPHPPFYPPTEFYRLVDQSFIELPPPLPPNAAPHHPHVVQKRREWRHLTDVERRQIIAAYYGMVALLDVYLGRVLDALKRLGVWDETIIVWTADHGDQLFENELLLKFVMRESALRVPMMVRVPGRAGRDRGEFVEQVDLFPTVCDLLGIEIPPSVQGRSLAPLMNEAPAPTDWRDAVFSQIHERSSVDTRMIRTERWKLNVYNGEPGELFDMENDPGEFHNLIGNPAHAVVIAELHKRIRQWQARPNFGGSRSNSQIPQSLKGPPA
ncbi:MAG: sulfatase-like hydrolase/transferase, partial [Candidatus Sumerlaeota bacterium]|nr:sulfatase-like hydrolase/transferase [Candidatus Sumerlaeota bacterium]